jgi:hypothetical protein
VEKIGSILEMIKMFYAYNSWATAQLINSLDQLSPEQLTAPGCSGHGTDPSKIPWPTFWALSGAGSPGSINP